MFAGYELMALTNSMMKVHNDTVTDLLFTSIATAQHSLIGAPEQV